MPTQAEKAQTFRELHEGEPFVIPNPWDAGSARMLAALGFEALATTSSGFAFTLGRLDGEATLDEVAAHVAALTEATELPVSVDVENGYGAEPEAAARAIERLQRFEAAGADVLYAPGLSTTEDISTVCAAVSRPVNVLAWPGLSFSEIADAGAARVSIGGRLTWVAVEAAATTARQLLDGDLSGLGSSPPLEDWFR